MSDGFGPQKEPLSLPRLLAVVKHTRAELESATAEETRDVKDAFHPESRHWGDMVSPVAEVIPADRCCPDCERPILLCRCGGGEKFINDFETG